MGSRYRIGQRFKQTVIKGTGNKAITSTTLVAVDSTNLPFIVVNNCVVGDVIDIDASFCCRHGTAGQYGIFDVEIDRPTSANIYLSGNSNAGFGQWMYEQAQAGYHTVFTGKARFVVTEPGDHGFRLVARVASGTLTVCNDSTTDGSDNFPITFSVQNIGPVDPH